MRAILRPGSGVCEGGGWRAFSVFDDGVGEELLGHVANELGGDVRAHLELEYLAHSHLFHLVVAEVREGLLDGLTLRVQHPMLETDGYLDSSRVAHGLASLAA